MQVHNRPSKGVPENETGSGRKSGSRGVPLDVVANCNRNTAIVRRTSFHELNPQAPYISTLRVNLRRCPVSSPKVGSPSASQGTIAEVKKISADYNDWTLEDEVEFHLPYELHLQHRKE